QKRPISTEQLVQIVDRIEADLFGDSDGEVEARQIGERVIDELKALDKVAYVRFASVYREFADVVEFVDTLLPFLRGETLAKLRACRGSDGRRDLSTSFRSGPPRAMARTMGKDKEPIPIGASLARGRAPARTRGRAISKRSGSRCSGWEGPQARRAAE